MRLQNVGIKNTIKICLALAPLLMVLSTWYFLKSDILNISKKLSRHCSKISNQSDYQSLLNGLVCGTPLEKDSASESLKKFSLTHLIVVSGSHFIILLGFIERFGISRWGIILCWLFNLTTGFQPPGTRAVLEITLRHFLKSKALFYPKEFLILFSWVITIMLFPEWISSFSLFMSLVCAWILSFTAPKARSLNLFLFHSICLYGAFAWCFFGLPVSISIWIVNQILSITISAIAFPLAFLAWWTWPFNILFDFLWRLIFKLTEQFEQGTASEASLFSFGVLIRVLVLALLLLIFHLWNSHIRKKQWN